MMPPRYQDIQAEEIPVIKVDKDVSIKVMAGVSNGVEGASKRIMTQSFCLTLYSVKGIVTSPLYLDITVPPSTTFSHPIEKGHNAFCYVIEGEGEFGPSGNGKKVTASTLACMFTMFIYVSILIYIYIA